MCALTEHAQLLAEIIWIFTYLLCLQYVCHLWTDGTLFVIVIFHPTLLLTKILISQQKSDNGHGPLDVTSLTPPSFGSRWPSWKVEWPLGDLVKCTLRDNILKLRFCLIGCGTC